jgi:serine/threonine protein kinase
MNIDLFEPPISLSKSDLEFQRKIGDGAFATVWRVKNKNTGNLHALKVVQKSKVAKILTQFRREVSIMYEVEHQHIVKLQTHFEDFKCFYLLMELAEGGSLFHKLFREKVFSEKVACEYFRQIISAVYYLHKHSPPIIHRDIKPENILLNKKGRVKLTDFGWANYLSSARYTTCGTLEYLPPEIIEEKGQDLSVDIWCLGVLLYEMLCGTTPFKANVKEMLVYNITRGVIRFPSTISQQAKDLILKMLDRKQQSRISIDEIINHNWVLSHGNDEIIDKTIDELTTATNFTDLSSCKSTKESFAEESCKKNDAKEELEHAKDKCKKLEEKIAAAKCEKLKLSSQEKLLKKNLYDASLELQHLQTTDTSSVISEKLHNIKKLNFDRAQLCKKQKFYLEKLKSKVLEKDKELADKESILKSLQEKVKSINTGFTKIKGFKSLDISQLKINLDVMQSQLGDKSSSYSYDFTIKDMKNLIICFIDKLPEFSKRDYERKIDECREKSIELEQKITEEVINFEDTKNRIQQGYRKIKDELFKVTKKNREDYVKEKMKNFEIRKQELIYSLTQAKACENPYCIYENTVSQVREKMKKLKENLMKSYLRIKTLRKERFRLRETIDVRDMEIDDIKFEIGKIKTISSLYH